MHEPHRYPHLNQPSPQGRISITIGKIAAEGRLDKAHPCHLRGTEVIARYAAKAATDSRVLTARLKPRPFKTIALSKHFKLSTPVNEQIGRAHV